MYTVAQWFGTSRHGCLCTIKSRVMLGTPCCLSVSAFGGCVALWLDGSMSRQPRAARAVGGRATIRAACCLGVSLLHWSAGPAVRALNAGLRGPQCGLCMVPCLLVCHANLSFSCVARWNLPPSVPCECPMHASVSAGGVSCGLLSSCPAIVVLKAKPYLPFEFAMPRTGVMSFLAWVCLCLIVVCWCFVVACLVVGQQ